MKKIIDADLSKYSGFRCGGSADILIEVENKYELKDAINSMEKEKKNWYFLGKGYNTLISDKGVRGVVLILGGSFSDITIKENCIVAGAGASLGEILKISVEKELAGLEFLAGIPGTVGGAIAGNSGTSKRSISDVVQEIEIFKSSTNSYKRLKNKEIGFAYRSCNLGNLDIITESVFNLKTACKTDIINKIKQNSDLKNKSQPVTDKNCGCVFKNVDAGETSVSKLIEMAGLKGFRIGGAEVSRRHANFIINTGKATSNDIWELIKKVKNTVKQKFNKNLELELNLLGEGFED